MTQKNVAYSQFHARFASGCGSGGNFGLSSGAGLSCGVCGQSLGGFGLSAGTRTLPELCSGADWGAAGGGASRWHPESSAHSLCLVERIMSRGGVMLDGGRRYAAAAVLTTAIGLTVIPDACALDVGPGQTSTGLTVDAGANNPMNVFGGGVANVTTINTGGKQSVYSGGSASSTTINSGGEQHVSANGSVIGSILNSAGWQYVSSNGSAVDTIINDGGHQNVLANGSAVGTSINNSGYQSVYSGGSAINTIINNGGIQYVYSNGVASDTRIVNGGTQYVSSGGSAFGTNIGSDGTQYLYSSGTVNTTTVDNGGSLHVEAGATAIMTGGSIIKDGGVLIAEPTATINLNGATTTLTIERGTITPNTTLNNRLTGDGALIKTGAGTLALTGVNSYSGGTMVSGGLINFNNLNNLGSGNITLNGGGLQWASGNTSDISSRLNPLGVNGGIFDTNGNDVTLGSAIPGPGSLTKDGAGTLTLAGANSYTGLTEVKDGTLALSGAGTISDTLALYGGTTFNPGGNPVSLSRLDVRGPATWTGNMNMAGQAINFYLSPAMNANDIILHVTGSADITGVSVGLDTSSGRPNINRGEKLILLDATGGITGEPVTLTVKTTSGDIYTLVVNANALQAILGQLSPSGPAYERLKAYVESRAANLAFVNDGQNFLLNQFGSALAGTAGQGFKFAPFGGLGGGWSRYKSGSHVDVSGLSLLAGLALGNDIPYGRFTLGVFFEGGWGTYTTYNSFSNSASAKGKGNTDYYGVGILGRYDVNQGLLSGLYCDASARMGWARTDFRTDDIQYNGWNASFESSAPYYGLHGGLGYAWNFTDKASLDLSAKLLWTRQQGASLTVYQDRLRFKDADSLRTRLGGRFAYVVNEYVSPYIGAYWEHEFDGKARAEVNGIRTGTPSLQGDTGMGEIGLSLKPSKDLPLSFDLGVQGYVGKREGVTGSLQVRYEF